MYPSFPLKLESNKVVLRPFLQTDLESLRPLALDEDIWKWMIVNVSNEEELQQWAKAAIADRAAGKRYTFVIEDKATGQLAGSTAYGSISPVDKRLEIGWTWLGKNFRGSGLNRHCKFLLLSYAFEVLAYERVEFKGNAQNHRSRQALKKIGATEEGILRSHTLLHTGSRRDTFYCSILKQEWAGIKERIFGDLEPGVFTVLGK